MDTRSSLDIKAFRQQEIYNIAYIEANIGPDHLIIMGREKDTRPYRDYDIAESDDGASATPNPYRNPWPRDKWHVMNPEKFKIKYDSDWNRMYWAGAIEAKKTFLLITPIQEIADRATKGLRPDYIRKGLGLGGTLPEVLWLDDNRYEATPHPNGSSRYTLFVPTSETPDQAVIQTTYDKWDSKNPQLLVARMNTIARQVEKKRRALLAEKSRTDYIAAHPVGVSVTPLAMPLPVTNTSSIATTGQNLTSAITSTSSTPTPAPSASTGPGIFKKVSGDASPASSSSPTAPSAWSTLNPAVKRPPATSTSLSASGSSPALPRRSTSSASARKPSLFNPAPTTLSPRTDVVLPSTMSRADDNKTWRRK